MAGRTRRTRPRTTLDAARTASHAALLQVAQQDAYLNLVLPGLLTEAGADERDRAFATELTHGTARMQGLYDAVLETLVKGGTAALQDEVAVALRLGCHQLLSMRVPAHAAVGTSVELVRDAVGERPVRLVNAVLRKVGQRTLAQWIERVAPDVRADRVGHLAVRYSHPRWVVEEFRRSLGEGDDVEQALVADNLAPRVTLAVRPGLAEVAELVAAGAAPGRLSPYAATLDSGDPAALEAVRLGRAGVQDEGSQLAALALARAEVCGEDRRWLDLCAGPGGKAALLAGLARRRSAFLAAADRQHHRAVLVHKGLRGYRGGAAAGAVRRGEGPIAADGGEGAMAAGSGVAVVTADGRRPPFGSATFDRVLADVPCTGLGALRRRPEARWRRRPEDIARLGPLQRDLLRSALDLVRVGGVVAYVTCSPVVAETREVVDAVLAGRAVAELEVAPLLPEVADTCPGPSVQLWPHRHGTDAMFVALLRRTA
jgi:16S rRNA (cytosine967-C5)-methyltransferase